MSLTPQTITIDLNPSFSQMQTVHCSQYDDNIRQIEVKLKDGGTDVDVSSYTIYIEGTKPDKKGFSYALTDIGEVDGNTVTFYVQLQMAAVPGMTRMEILLKDGDDHRIGSANFMLAVERAGLQDDTDVSDSELAPYIAGAAQQAQAAANSAAAAEQAKDDAVQAKESAEQSAESISGLSEQIEQNTEDCRDLKNAFEQLPTSIQPDMTVGNVFSDDSYTSDQTPYLYRVSGGGVEVGKVEADTIVGGSVAWNQQINSYVGSRTVKGLTFTNNGTSISVSGTIAEAFDFGNIVLTNYSAFKRDGSKYLILLSKKVPYKIGIAGFNTGATNSDGFIWTNTGGGTWRGAIAILSSTVGQEISIDNLSISVFDLTQMFGSTIADYIYTLEWSTAGAGIAWFKKLFPNDYYEYNAGELMHVSGLSEHVMVGKNIYPVKKNVTYTNAGVTINTDEDGVIHVSGTATSRVDYSLIEGHYGTGAGLLTLPAGTYTVSVDGIAGVSGVEIIFGGSGSAVTYKAFHGALWNPYTFTLSADGQTGYNFLRVPSGTTVNATFKIQFEVGNTATAYEPYKKQSYALDSSLTLRGIPKLDANNNIYYDGDVYTADGTVTRKYGIVDLGTLNWQYLTSASVSLFRAQVVGLKTGGADSASMLCEKYPWISTYNRAEKTISQNYSNYIDIIDSTYTDAASFKTAMSGVYLVYELATPTTENAEPYEEYQHVTNGGTEEYVSTGIVPVGHNTKYYGDIGAKVDKLPSDFSNIIAPTETAFKATRAYTVNDLIIIDNVLYKVTASIASGATITPNTNVQQTTLSALIKALSA